MNWPIFLNVGDVSIDSNYRGCPHTAMLFHPNKQAYCVTLTTLSLLQMANRTNCMTDRLHTVSLSLHGRVFLQCFAVDKRSGLFACLLASWLVVSPINSSYRLTGGIRVRLYFNPDSSLPAQAPCLVFWCFSAINRGALHHLLWDV